MKSHVPPIKSPSQLGLVTGGRATMTAWSSHSNSSSLNVLKSFSPARKKRLKYFLRSNNSSAEYVLLLFSSSSSSEEPRLRPVGP